MKTLLLSALDAETPQIAADLMRRGELVAIPTETVYGLGANGLDEAAVTKIFEAKGRPQDNPLILHICGAEQIALVCHDVPAAASELAKKFWPGPLTMVLPARDCVPRRTTGGLSTVAVRCPDNAVTREIIRLAGVPIAIKDVVAAALKGGTDRVVLCHNHPNGVALPSREDIQATENIVRALGLVHVLLRDHIILTETEYFSMREENRLPFYDLATGEMLRPY